MSDASNRDQEQLFAKAHVLKDLVTYQDGAVVSRTLIDKEVGTVTLFSFDHDQGLSEHTAPFDAMILALDGEAEMEIGGSPLRLVAGDMTIMPANSPHRLRALTRFKMLLIMVRST